MARNKRTRSTQITFNAKVLPTHGNPGQVTLEFDGLTPISLDGMSEVKMFNPEDGTKRDFTTEERADFEQAIDNFVDMRMARALKSFIAYSQPGEPKYADEVETYAQPAYDK